MIRIALKILNLSKPFRFMQCSTSPDKDFFLRLAKLKIENSEENYHLDFSEFLNKVNVEEDNELNYNYEEENSALADETELTYHNIPERNFLIKKDWK